MLAVALAAALIASACGSDDLETEARAEPASLTLVTHDSFVVSDDVLAEFTEQTGVEVSILQGGDAGSALNQAILTKDNPEGDVFFGVDNTFLSRALENDLFVTHEAAGLDAVDPSLVLDDSNRVTPVDTGDVCLNYDVAALAEMGVEPPTDLADLISPEYAGLTVVPNPASSSPGLAFLLATVDRFGEAGWEAYWSSLRDNDVEVVSGWEDAYYGSYTVSGGDRPIVVSYASSPPAEVVFAETPIDEPFSAVVLESCFRQIEFAGILAGTEHPDEAAQLVDFFLSDSFQADLPLNMYVFPVTDVALPEVFVDHARVADEPLMVDPVTIAENREEWLATWTDVVLR
jgi:thiamine transport system substrate-binding protein